MGDMESESSAQPFWEALRQKAFQRLGDLQKQGLLCDLTLRSKDQVEFQVHKVGMCVVSGFFRDMLTSDFKDSSESIIELNVSTGAVLAKVVSFVYQGDLTAESAEDYVEIAKVAKYLQIDELTELCTLRLKDLINDGTCLSCWRLAKGYLIEDVEEICVSYIRSSVERLFQDPVFVNVLTAAEMKVLLGDERLECSPEILFKKIEKWAEKNSRSKDEFVELFLDVIDYVPFSSLSREFLLTNVFTQEVLMEDKRMLKKLVECMKLKWEEKENPAEELPPKLESEDTERPLEGGTQLLALRGPDVLSISTTDRQMKKTHENCHLFKNFGYTTFRGKFLFVCGGTCLTVPQNACNYFSTDTKQWTAVKPMPFSRCNHQCAYLDGKIYACGGRCEGSRSRNVEIFDGNTDLWTTGPYMKSARSSFGLTALNGSLYAVGGQGVSNARVLDIEMLDPRASNLWRIVLSRFQTMTHGQCVAIGSDIYCFRTPGESFIFDTRMNSCRNWKLHGVSADAWIDYDHVFEIDGEIGCFSPDKSMFYKIDLQGNVREWFPLSDTSNSLGYFDALVALDGYC